nr:hypothetical protein CFP56_60268 [Quercus suber]
MREIRRIEGRRGCRACVILYVVAKVRLGGPAHESQKVVMVVLCMVARRSNGDDGGGCGGRAAEEGYDGSTVKRA